MRDGSPLHGRIAVVTGAAQGIGQAIAQRLALNGAFVVVNDLEESVGGEVAAQIRAQGGDAVSFPADVATADGVDGLIGGVLETWGHVDVLVNNAGWDEAKWFVDSQEADWRRVIDVNFVAVLRTCRSVLPSMIEQSRGRIINIGSATAKTGFPTEAVYSGAKGAVAAFTRSLAREIGEYGITANVVAPGPTETPLTTQFNREIEADPSFKKLFPTGPVRSLVAQIPLGRMGRPNDVASVVTFLASDAAEFITGQSVAVDGGYTM